MDFHRTLRPTRLTGDAVMQELVTKTDLKEAIRSMTLRLASITAALTGLVVGIVAVLLRLHS